MIYVEADNILTPLGATTEQNVAAVVAGQSALRAYTDAQGLLEPYTASLFTAEQNEAMAVQGLSAFESMVVSSAHKALAAAAIDVASPRTVLVVSSTKGNVELLKADAPVPDEYYLGESARHIAAALGVTTTPLTVCNACISGLSAIILAQRLLDAGHYDHAIVCGADCQSRFIISGFQSLKALSSAECRPFDMERTGLNLGEAAATIVLGREQTRDGQWAVMRGSVHNDAYHTTQPAKRGDGLLLCLQDVVRWEREEGREERERLGRTACNLALVNAHGTATLFNDQMESVAIERAGLSDVPVNALKGYFGHTMGAAGILETIITMHTLDQHIIIGTRGCEERGVSGQVKLSASHQPTDKTAFVKTISGFGGCNAAVLVERLDADKKPQTLPLGKTDETASPPLRTTTSLTAAHYVRITPQSVVLDGKTVEAEGTGLSLLTCLYKATGGDYPKFYKMDALSRLGYVVTELLASRAQLDDATACILFNRSSSVASDRKYLASIADAENYFPSPSVFIYTLPNIVTGELAIRHGFHGETSFYILPDNNEALQQQVVQATLAATGAEKVITGWLDYEDENRFEAHIRLLQNTATDKADGSRTIHVK